MDRTILKGGILDMGALSQLRARPPLFEKGDSVFWTDPYISEQILQAHLDPDTERASRRMTDISASVRWMSRSIGLAPGDKVLDLGCGPGLYTLRMAQQGFDVTGVDQCIGSIQYARDRAREVGMDVDYRVMDILEIPWHEKFDLVTMIYVDLGTFSDQERVRLFSAVDRCLRPDGRFLFDTRTPLSSDHRAPRDGWAVKERGFWRPSPYLLLDETMCYPEEDVALEQYVVVEPEGKATLYRVWTRFYSTTRMDSLLESVGFEVIGRWSDLKGTPWSEGSEWMGVLTGRRRDRPL